MLVRPRTPLQKHLPDGCTIDMRPSDLHAYLVHYSLIQLLAALRNKIIARMTAVGGGISFRLAISCLSQDCTFRAYIRCHTNHDYDAPM